MDRLRKLTERDRLGEAVAKLEAGEEVDWQRLADLQPLDTVVAGRAALLDALDREDQADADLERIVRGG